MFGILENLAKATVGLAVVAPAALVVDVFTMGGAMTDKDEPYTASALKDVWGNLEKAANPDSK